tara:strand:+ start:456 stop:728 length:273 start_codon:yes stop_codon:yes gene_type:complete
MVTQTYLDSMKQGLACKLSCLAVKYTDALHIGNSCADKIKCDMVIANNLLKILALVRGDDLDTCVTGDEICTIMEKIKLIIKLNDCACGC